MFDYINLYHSNLYQVEAAKRAFQSEDAIEEEEEEREASPKAVGHNIFILAKQVGNFQLL